MKHYDIAVIGAGSGGLVAATSAHRRGAKVALLEKNKIGGECTHSGCVPSKTLISSARAYQATKHTEARRLKELERKNARLKKIVADLSLDNEILKEALSKK